MGLGIIDTKMLKWEALDSHLHVRHLCTKVASMTPALPFWFVGHRNCEVLSFYGLAIGVIAALLSLHRVLAKCGLMSSRSKHKQPVKIFGTGAAGQIGYSLLLMIARGAILGPDQPIILHLLDVPPAEGLLHGLKMELIDAALPLLKGVVATTDAVEACTGANITIVVGGFPRKEGMERKDVMSKNVSIYKAQASALEKHAATYCKIVVVANQANTNALILKEFAPSIPADNITCLTRLDLNRAPAHIAERLSVHASEVKNVIIWGNHSAQHPDARYATVATQPGEQLVRELIADDEWLNDEFVGIVRQRGATIIGARRLSSALSAASAASDHKGTWVSMGVCLMDPYGVPVGLIYSFPVTY